MVCIKRPIQDKDDCSSQLSVLVTVTWQMAIAAKKVEIAKDGDTTVGCVTDIVVDTEEGIVAEKKTFAVSVPDGKGGTTVVYGQAIQATKIVSVVTK